MADRNHSDAIPDHRVPDILARAAELDRSREETSSVDALRAVALDAGISISSLEAALAEYATDAPAEPVVPKPPGAKDTTTGTLLSLFLGGFGAHRFYLGDKWGLLYLLFIWTMVPSVMGIIEAFFMPDRVRAFNRRAELVEAIREHRLQAAKEQKKLLSEEQKKLAEPDRRPCPQCAEMIMPQARICRYCGSPVA